MALSRDERNARARAKRVAWRVEIGRLQREQGQRIADEQKRAAESQSVRAAAWRREVLLTEVHQKICSAEFQSWYEATTGEAVAGFIAEVVLTRDQYHARPKNGLRLDQLEWTQALVERLVLKNPWTNPESRAYWSSEVLAAKTPRERRVAIMHLATPRWASIDKMMVIYAEREAISRSSGIPHDVDHIVPLVSPIVCGLHNEFNLRVVTSSVNRSKSNKFDIDGDL